MNHWVEMQKKTEDMRDHLNQNFDLIASTIRAWDTYICEMLTHEIAEIIRLGFVPGRKIRTEITVEKRIRKHTSTVIGYAVKDEHMMILFRDRNRKEYRMTLDQMLGGKANWKFIDTEKECDFNQKIRGGRGEE